MAVTPTTVFQGQNMFVATVAAWADGDTTGNVNHGLATAPAVVIYTPTATAAVAAVAAVACTTIDATKVSLSKTNVSAGSGAAAAGILICMTPHSIVK